MLQKIFIGLQFIFNSQFKQAMDLNFRLKENNQGNEPKRNFFVSQEAQAGLNRYAKRNTNPRNRQDNSNRNSRTTSQKEHQILNSSLSKYVRSDSAPKNQFKRYLLDVTNVFYEERKEIEQAKFYSLMKNISGLLFVLFLLSALCLFFIKPFQNQCPLNADCGVFVHCYHGYDYNSERNECVLSPQFVEQIENICLQRIVQQRLQWGNTECQGNLGNQPIIRVDHILSGIDNYQLRTKLKYKLSEFLQKEQNQKEHFFIYTNEKIIPKEKIFSLGCKLKKLVKSQAFQFGAPSIILGLIAAFFILGFVRKNVIGKKIYLELRKKTLKENMLNISYAKQDIQKQYGVIINEDLWTIIDKFRTKDKDIGFVQDGFLYWKKL